MESREKFISLLFTVLVPYLKEKGDKLYKKLQVDSDETMFEEEEEDVSESAEEEQEGGIYAKYIRWATRKFKKGYPYLHFLYEGSIFLFQFLYLYGKTHHFDPSLFLQGLHVRRLSPDDILLHEKQKSLDRLKTMDYIRKTLGRNFLLTLLVKSSFAISDALKYAIPLSVFFFKFLEFWYSEENQGAQKRELPIPPPPELPKKAKTSEIQSLREKGSCPLCGKKRVNPCVSVSGYLFCYPCLYDYVQEHKRCPVTHQPNSISQIRKIFES